MLLLKIVPWCEHIQFDAASLTRCASIQEARRKLASFIEAQTGSITDALAQRLPRNAQASLRHNYALAGLLVATNVGGRALASSLGTSQTCTTAQSLLTDMPSSQNALLLSAAATGLLHSPDDSIEAVKQWVNEHPDADVTQAILMGAHIASSAQPPKLEAALLLLGHPRLPQAVVHAPAVLATRACLRERLTVPQAAKESQQELHAAIEWWTNEAADSGCREALAACHEHQAALQLRQGESQAALQSLTALQVCTCTEPA